MKIPAKLRFIPNHNPIGPIPRQVAAGGLLYPMRKFGVQLTHKLASDRELRLSLGELGKLGELGEEAVGARTTSVCMAEGRLNLGKHTTAANLPPQKFYRGLCAYSK